jgi:hypothetical protein
VAQLGNIFEGEDRVVEIDDDTVRNEFSVNMQKFM